jgi:hypothetical protein
MKGKWANCQIEIGTASVKSGKMAKYQAKRTCDVNHNETLLL